MGTALMAGDAVLRKVAAASPGVGRAIERIVAAGPTLGDDDAPNGSVLVMEFDDMAQAQAFADNDPYAKAGVFESGSIKPLKKVFPKE